MTTSITVQTTVNVPASVAWQCWTEPRHITGWNFASPDWSCPSAINDLRPEGKFSWRMEAKDGSMGFDFCGSYQKIDLHSHIALLLDDGRAVSIAFAETNGQTTVTETFEAENQNPVDLQRTGWQTILDNFKRYAEAAAMNQGQS